MACELGRRLSLEGHEIVLATTEPHRHYAENLGFDFRPLPKITLDPFACAQESLGKNPFARTPTRRRARMRAVIGGLGAVEFGDILDSVEPDLALIDFELHGPILTALSQGRRTALLHHLFSTAMGPGNPPLGSHTVPGQGSEGAPASVNGEWAEFLRWKRRQQLIGALKHWGGDLPSALDHLARRSGVPENSFDRRRWQYPWGYTLPYLVTGPAELDFAGDGSEDFRFVGPLIAKVRPNTQAAEPLSGVEPTSDRPVVLASFGTVNTPPVAFLEALWSAFALRPDWTLIHAIPRGSAAPSHPAPANVTVVEWVDQPAVLETARVMINHGGTGSVREAADCGIPQIAVAANTMDRPGGAARVVFHGLGARLMGTETAEEIATTIDRVLHDKDIAGACARMSDASRRYTTDKVAENEVRRLLEAPPR